MNESAHEIDFTRFIDGRVYFLKYEDRYDRSQVRTAVALWEAGRFMFRTSQGRIIQGYVHSVQELDATVYTEH